MLGLIALAVLGLALLFLSLSVPPVPFLPGAPLASGGGAWRPANGAWRAFFFAGAMFVLLFLMPALPAWAQAAPAAPSTRIDFAPLLNEYVWPTIGSALLALAMWAFKLLREWLKAKTGVELQHHDATVRAYLDKALERAIAYGKSKTEGYTSVDVKNVTIAHAANYALSQVPDALKRFGIDGEALERLLEARLGASPAPSAPAAGST